MESDAQSIGRCSIQRDKSSDDIAKWDNVDIKERIDRSYVEASAVDTYDQFVCGGSKWMGLEREFDDISGWHQLDDKKFAIIPVQRFCMEPIACSDCGCFTIFSLRSDFPQWDKLDD